jgi:hypothetical protein
MMYLTLACVCFVMIALQMVELRYGVAGSVVVGDGGVLRKPRALCVRPRPAPGERVKHNLRPPVRVIL